jgi:hypothetical protein
MIPRYFRILVAAQVIWELLRYDLLAGTSGFRGVHSRSRWPVTGRGRVGWDLSTMVPRIVAAASAFYWKPILCLQRSVVTVRVLRRHGINAEVVIGCRPAPFVGHAWVEVDGRVVNDSPGYQQKLAVLARF